MHKPDKLDKFKLMCEKHFPNREDSQIILTLFSDILVERINTIKEQLINKTFVYVDEGETMDHICVKFSDIYKTLEFELNRAKELVNDKHKKN